MVLGRKGEVVTADWRKLPDGSFVLCAPDRHYWGNRIMDDGLGG
jgi:hypothetical protein